MLMSSTIAFSKDPTGGLDRNEIRYISNNKNVPNEAIQRSAREVAAWQDFLLVNGTWYAQFREETMMPALAYGRPISTSGATVEDRAINFLADQLEGFNLHIETLELTSVVNGKFNTYVNFSQTYMGLKVIDSRVKVKLTENNEVIQFKTDVHDINLSIEPALTIGEAIQLGQLNMVGDITDIHPASELKVLPVPVNGVMEYHLVYEMEIQTISEDGIPGLYITLVDANSGTVLSRTNLVMHCDHVENTSEDHVCSSLPGGPSLTINGAVYEENPFVAAVNNPLAYVEVQQGGNTFNANINGNISSGLTAGNAAVRLSGPYSYVQTNGVTPEFTATVNSGPTLVSFDGNGSTEEMSAYYHVNIVHDFMKTKFPSFTDMDVPLQTNVDLTGDCNAFYNGISINFYLEGNDCNSFANVGDVVYHEYGHGINDKYYQAQGGSFNNGALNEGYADIWGMGITLNPILGSGTSTSDPLSFIRRYDVDPKVYPIDIVGEVHADGEIIAGAWWDLGQIWGDVQQMMDLFSATFDATISAPNGDEGTAFTEVLVEALQLDDVPANGGDNNIENGTPNDIDIVTAFGLHGITLLSNATLTHEPIMASNEDDIPINVDVTLVYPWALDGAKLFYALNDEVSFTEIDLVNTSGIEYSATIPGQPNGTVIGYFVSLVNLDGTLSSVSPVAANLNLYPNVPNFIMVGYEVAQFQDFDNQQGNWTEGMPDDDATTGQWVIDIPVPSFADNGVMVQTDLDVTPGSGNIACALTGNGSIGGGIGENDVDGGKTTLVTPVFDLTQYDDPAVTYYRYYTNGPPGGANPGADWWQVELTSDGSNWVGFESTLTQDMSWRRVAFRVSDYVPVTSTFQMRFVAADSLRPGQNLDGGSLVEAAVDDLYIWEPNEGNSIAAIYGVNSINIFPNPTASVLTVRLEVNEPTELDLTVVDIAGRELRVESGIELGAGRSNIILNTDDLDSGSYQLILNNNKSIFQKQFTVVH
jgi:Zn-dependent metalloprotease